MPVRFREGTNINKFLVGSLQVRFIEGININKFLVGWLGLKKELVVKNPYKVC